MNNVQKARLQKVIDFLREVPASNFDLSDFVSSDKIKKTFHDNPEVAEDVNRLYKAKEVHNCGTTACACGYLPVIFPSTFKYEFASVVHKNYLYEVWDVPREFFGIQHFKAFDYLFMPDSYHPSKRGPKSVAARLEKVLRNNGKIPENYKRYDA